MKNMRVFNKIMSVVLAMIMVLSMLPMSVFATEATQTDVDVGETITGAAVIGQTGYADLAAALTAAATMTGDVTVEICDKVTLNSNLTGSYDSITFVGKDTDAEIYLDVQGYITATGKKVAFEDLTLSKAEGGFITNAGFMNVAFGVYDVAEVTYTNCTFANGAYAAAGDVTFTGCTFYRSHDKYGLWAYGNVDATVDGCTFADYRGIKMYAEGAAKTVDLTVTNTDFSALTGKPAIVLTYGESVTLEKNTYSSTGAFELDLGGAPNGTPVITDSNAIVCVNDNGACGVLVDGKIYTTVAQAAAVAASGSTVTLLHNSNETVELPEGVTLNTNGYTADGVTVKVTAPTSGLTNCYTSDAAYWGECGGNAKESFVFKFYNGETYMGYTSLNNVGGIIDGDVYVSWHIKLDAASNTDEYWTMAWEIQPTLTMQPTRVEHWVDGVKAAEVAVEPNWSDSIFPVVAAVTDEDGKILSYVNGTSGHTLADAVAEGGNIALLRDVTLTDTLTVPAGVTLALDLNGYTISQTKAQTAGYQMILNDGNLTIKDSVGGGKISYTDSGNGGEYISDTIYNRGVLVINGGTIENLSSATVASNGYPHAVDTYSGIRDTSVTINGGTIYCAEYSAIRMFCVSATNKADLIINGGTIKGAIDMQNGTTAAALGSLTIEGGTFETTKNANNVRFANWNGGAATYGIAASIKGGSFNGGISTQYVPAAANWDSKIIIGGTFTTDVSAYCAEGFELKNNGDGTYGVVEAVSAVAYIGEVGYATLAEALTAAQAGDTVTIVAGDYTGGLNVNKAITVIGQTDAEGNNLVNISGKLSISADGAAVKNINVNNGGSTAGSISGKDVLVEGCCVVGSNGFRYCYTSGTVTFKDSTITGDVYGIHFDGNANGNIVIDNCVVTGWTSFAGTIEKVTMTDTEFAEGNYNYIRFYQDADISGCTFNEKMGVDVADSVEATVTVTNSTVTNGSVKDLFAANDIVNSDIIVDGEQLTYTAAIGDTYYETLAEAFSEVQEGQTIQLLAGTISEGTVKMPATLKNVTIKGAAENASILKDMTVSAADGNSYSYVGLTFDGIVFENSRILLTGWRNGEEIIEDLTVTNCTFKNLHDDSNSAPVHINKDAAEAVKNFTFTNNVIDGATGGSKSGVYAQLTGEVVFTDNIINNVSFRPYVIQLTTDDGIDDTFTVTGNTFSGSAVGRAQGLGSNAEGTDAVALTVNNNIFKGITDAQQICYWNFNAETTTADISKNYYDIDLAANPNRIYYNGAASSVEDLVNMGVYPVYTELNANGTINEASEFTPVLGLAGSGTAEDPFQIADLDDLKLFRDEVNAGNTYKGKYVKLTANIDLNGEGWTPIGNSTNKFEGTFDGGDCTISNLVINMTGQSNVGLFGFTTTGEIKNLTVNNAQVTGRLNVGVVAGTPYTSKYTNIKVTGHVEVNGMAYVGGVGGKNAYANWTDITVDVDADSYVKATSTENGTAYRTYVGGVIGFNGEGSHTFKNITSNIKVIGDVCDIGGIFGIAHYGNNFENMTFTGAVEAPEGAEEVGGIAGVWHNEKGYTITMTDVTSTGTVTVGTETVTGSIVGGAYNASNETADTSGSLVIDGEEAWLKPVVATVDGVSYITLQEAVNNAAGKTVTLSDDVLLTETLVIPAPVATMAEGESETVNSTVTIDLAGKTISQSKECTASYSMIENRGDLTIIDSVGGGKISFTDTSAGDPNFGWGSYTVANYGVLTVENGTVENLSAQNANGSVKHMYCAIQQGYGAVSTTINGGTISTPSYRSIRSNTGALIINGGNFEGQVWIQPNQGNATLTITGGTFAPRGVDGSSVFMTNAGENYTVSEAAISGGTFTTKIGASDPAALAGTITGGSFSASAVSGTNTALLTEGYMFGTEADENGYYGIVAKPVAQVGSTTYASIDDAIANWTAGTTLTLLADVTLSDVITIKSTEHHILNLGTYTMTAASGKHAILITAEGVGTAARSCLTINADSENPGGITATGKACIYYNNANKIADRLMVTINGGVFNGSYAVNSTSGPLNSWGNCTSPLRGQGAPYYVINGGTFDAQVYLNAAMLKVTGGTFNKNLTCMGDSTAYRLITGGTFKSMTMTADAEGKFTIGSAKSSYDAGLYVDDNGYLVVGGPVITEPGETFEASSTNYGGWSSYLKYSSAATNGLYYTSVEEALADNNKATGAVTIYTDELDLTDLNYKGTLNVSDELTVTFAEGTTPVWTVAAVEDGKVVTYTETVADGVVTRVYTVIAPVAQIGDVKYASIDAALAAAVSGDTITLLADAAMETIYEVKDMVLTIEGDAALTLNDKLIVLGETTLNISATISGDVTLGHNAILKNSTINGSVFVAGKVIFRGANTVGMVYDFGTLTDYYGTSANMEWTVEEGSSLTIVNTGRYGLGYGDKVTIYGSLTDALTARENLTDGDVAFFTHGIVAQESKGWNCNSSMTVKDAYVIIGDNNSFGNKPGNYGGIYTFDFENVVLNGSRITFYEALSTTTFNFTNSDVQLNSAFMTRDADSEFTLTNTKLVVLASAPGNDERSCNAGTLNLVNSVLQINKRVEDEQFVYDNTGIINADVASRLVVDLLNSTGTIVIDATGFTADEAKVIEQTNAAASSLEGKVTINNLPADYTVSYEDGDVTIVKAAEPVAQTKDANGNVIGTYADFESAVAAAVADATVARIEVLSDINQETIAAPGETYAIAEGQYLAIGAPEGASYTVVLGRDAGKTFSIYQRSNNSGLTIDENIVIEGLDIIAGGFATSGNNVVINGSVKLLSLKVWTSNEGIVIGETGKVWMGYGDGQLDLAYGNGSLTVNGDGTKTEPQFKAGYSGTRGNGNTLNLNNTYFEAGAWFNLNGSNGTINANNSVLTVSGGDSSGKFNINSTDNTVNLTNGSVLKVANIALAEGNEIVLGAGSSIEATKITGAGTITIDATGMTAGNVATITGDASGFTGAIEVINNDSLIAEIRDGKIVLIEKAEPAATIDAYGDVNVTGDFGTDAYRESYRITVMDVYAEESLVVELWSGETKLSTTTLRETDRDDGTAINISERMTANIVVNGRLSGSWDTEWHVAPTIANVPNTIKVYADGILTDTKDGAFPNETEKAEYLALTGVYKAAQIGETYYATLADAIAAAQNGDTITLMADLTDIGDAFVGGKTVTIDGDGHTVSGESRLGASYYSTTGDITFKNINFKGITPGKKWSAIMVNHLSGTVTVDNCTFTNVEWDDIQVASNKTGAKVVITNCTFDGNGARGIHIQPTTAENANMDITITGNKFYKTDANATSIGIWFPNATSTLNIEKNYVEDPATISISLLNDGINTNYSELALPLYNEALTEEIKYVAKVQSDVYTTNFYTTVTEAITAAADGDTIQLLPGTIEENVVHLCGKSITIVGADNFGTTMTGGLNLGIDQSKNNGKTVTIKGIAFEGKGILTAGIGTVTIEGNKFTNINDYVATSSSAAQNAISVIGKDIVAVVKDNVIENVTAGEASGIHLRDVMDVTVTGNTVTNTAGNSITVNESSSGVATSAVIENNTLTTWGVSGNGRAIRSTADSFTANGNVMTCANAPEQFIKATGTTSIDVSKNYWNGVDPTSGDYFAADDGVDAYEAIVNYYTDAEKTNLVTLTKVELAKFIGTNIHLGNTLAMNFAIDKDLFPGTGYYVVIESSDGDEQIEKTIQMADWELTPDGGYYKFTYEGLAARQMCDEITMTVYDTEGKQVSEAKTDSIRGYILRNWDKQTGDEIRTLFVDMLNYGAAAQQEFTYKTDDLANSLLTDVQKAYATTELETCTDQRTVDVDGYYVGTNLVLRNRIAMNFAFKNVTSDMRAEITFTHHGDTEVTTVNIPGSEFKVDGKYMIINVDEIVAADGRQLVTCVIYDADGTQVVSVTDSVESYVARMGEEVDCLYELMMYSDAAYNYLNKL